MDPSTQKQPLPAIFYETSVPRKDGIGKATGGALYADDIVLPGMLHGRTIRSTIPRGRIRSIRLDFDPTGFTDRRLPRRARTPTWST